jgi:hypothetical protein
VHVGLSAPTHNFCSLLPFLSLPQAAGAMPSASIGGQSGSRAMTRGGLRPISPSCRSWCGGHGIKKDSTLIRLPKNKKAPRWSGTPKLIFRNAFSFCLERPAVNADDSGPGGALAKSVGARAPEFAWAFGSFKANPGHCSVRTQQCVGFRAAPPSTFASAADCGQYRQAAGPVAPKRLKLPPGRGPLASRRGSGKLVILWAC